MVDGELTALLICDKHRVVGTARIVAIEVVILIEVQVLMLHCIVIVVHYLTGVHRFVVLML